MEERKNKIINYLILLQIYKYKIETVRKTFEKYGNLLGKKIEDCVFEFDKKDQTPFSRLSSEIKKNAIECYEQNMQSILFYEDSEYPLSLRNVEEYPIVLFYSGNLNLLNRTSISIVGTRNPNEKSIFDTQRISKFLISKKIIIVSGLAKGIDVIAHKQCMECGNSDVIAVIGTPINVAYPKENELVQKYISTYGLLLSEYPPFQPTQKWNFLRRNYVMSAISAATIVMQAGDTSGTVSQARSTLKNRRPLFVPANVFDDVNNSWPHKFRDEFANVYRFQYLDELKELIESKMELK